MLYLLFFVLVLFLNKINEQNVLFKTRQKFTNFTKTYKMTLTKYDVQNSYSGNFGTMRAKLLKFKVELIKEGL